MSNINLTLIKTCDKCGNTGKRIRHKITCPKYNGKRKISNDTNDNISNDNISNDNISDDNISDDNISDDKRNLTRDKKEKNYRPKISQGTHSYLYNVQDNKCWGLSEDKCKELGIRDIFACYVQHKEIHRIPHQVDHITKRCTGGEDDLINYQILCSHCHDLKTQYTQMYDRHTFSSSHEISIYVKAISDTSRAPLHKGEIEICEISIS
jgi:hypothetical protein